VVTNKNTQRTEKYELLNVIEFTSNRKRMSVIVKDEQGRIIVMTKGADSIIIPRLRKGQEELVSQTNEHLLGFANEGLRTLLIAKK